MQSLLHLCAQIAQPQQVVQRAALPHLNSTPSKHDTPLRSARASASLLHPSSNRKKHSLLLLLLRLPLLELRLVHPQPLPHLGLVHPQLVQHLGLVHPQLLPHLGLTM